MDSAQHGRPGFTDDEFAAHIWADFVAVVIDHDGVDSEEGQRSRAGFGWNRSGQRGDHDGAGFGLPPSIDNRTPAAADDVVVPHPRFWVNGFADGA